GRGGGRGCSRNRCGSSRSSLPYPYAGSLERGDLVGKVGVGERIARDIQPEEGREALRPLDIGLRRRHKRPEVGDFITAQNQHVQLVEFTQLRDIAQWVVAEVERGEPRQLRQRANVFDFVLAQVQGNELWEAIERCQVGPFVTRKVERHQASEILHGLKACDLILRQIDVL